MTERLIRLTAWTKPYEHESFNGPEMIGDIIEFYARDRDRYKMYHRMIRNSIRSLDRTRLIIEDPSKPWIKLTERQNRIADARVCVEQIKLHRARLRAALSGNYENCP